jgi:hypothetical protein
MYLRLKHHHPTGFVESRPIPAGAPAIATVGNELLCRHYAAFDWQNGGPPGTVKYIDLHQLELAAQLALAGDCRARLMMKRYVRGIAQLITRPDSGAAHYATGPAWDTPCLTRTLAGQAVTIQALVIAGRLKRVCAHKRVVADLARFAAARWVGVASGDIRAAETTDDRPLPRELAWYVSALGAFAELYDDARLRTAAHRGFGRLTTLLRAMNGELRHSVPELALTDRVAIATVASEFSAAGSDVELAHFARRDLVECARRHAHPAGGWIQTYRDGAPPDVDCSIDLVRTADALGSRDHPELARIAADGKLSLFKPEIAFARAVESGLLLLLTDASGDRAPLRTAVVLRDGQARFPRDRAKLLVNIRK